MKPADEIKLMIPQRCSPKSPKSIKKYNPPSSYPTTTLELNLDTGSYGGTGKVSALE